MASATWKSARRRVGATATAAANSTRAAIRAIVFRRSLSCEYWASVVQKPSAPSSEIENSLTSRLSGIFAPSAGATFFSAPLARTPVSATFSVTDSRSRRKSARCRSSIESYISCWNCGVPTMRSAVVSITGLIAIRFGSSFSACCVIWVEISARTAGSRRLLVARSANACESKRVSSAYFVTSATSRQSAPRTTATTDAAALIGRGAAP